MTPRGSADSPVSPERSGDKMALTIGSRRERPPVRVFRRGQGEAKNNRWEGFSEKVMSEEPGM